MNELDYIETAQFLGAVLNVIAAFKTVDKDSNFDEVRHLANYENLKSRVDALKSALADVTQQLYGGDSNADGA